MAYRAAGREGRSRQFELLQELDDVPTVAFDSTDSEYRSITLPKELIAVHDELQGVLLQAERDGPGPVIPLVSRSGVSGLLRLHPCPMP